MIPRLHLVLDLAVLEQVGRDPVAVATAAVRGGVGAVHVRAPGYPASMVLALVLALRAPLAGRALLLVNDRLDVALSGNADGVQLPASGLAPGTARALVAQAGRRVLGAPGRSCSGDPGLPAAPAMRAFVIGASVHTPEAARAAECEQADFVLLGTVYPSTSHPEGASGGEALVRAARAATSLPLIAIGGIAAHHVGSVLAAGADGIAVIRAIAAAPDPEAAAAALFRVLEQSAAPPSQGEVARRARLAFDTVGQTTDTGGQITWP